MYPERVAVKTDTHVATYNELNKTANRIAHAILARRRAGQGPVALLLEDDAPIIAAILGVLKAGKFYLPLYPNDPPARIAAILQDSESGLVVGNKSTCSTLNQPVSPGFRTLNVDDLDDGLSDENPGLPASSDMIAYIMYTSGSTGEPKAVLQNHRNVLQNALLYTNYLHICAADRLSLLHSYSNGASLNNLLGALLNGGTLFPFDIKKKGVAFLARYLGDEGITIYHSIPSLFRSLVDTMTGSEDCSKLRVVHLSGDAASKKDVELYKKYFSSDCILLNRLGSREAKGLFWYFIDKSTEIAGPRVPLGFPPEGTEVLLLDDDKIQVNFGAIGEIAIRSRYLSPGYCRRPDITKGAFLADVEGGDKRIYLTGDLGRQRPDGCFEHLGRKDFQVKIRGYRVEIAELESALMGLGAVKEAVVMACEGRPEDPSAELGTGGKRLVAYVVPAESPAPTVSTLRRNLAEKLPEYMIPSAFVMLDAMPLTATGKVDRRALPALDPLRPDLAESYVAPQSPVEKVLAGIWAKVLSLDRVGIHDNFFDLGGNSLAAIRVLSLVIKNYQLDLTLLSLFRDPTVAEMALMIEGHRAKTLEQNNLDRILTELEALSEEDAQRVLSRIMQKDAS
jgi:amino acid adenylation domain-containing protein